VETRQGRIRVAVADDHPMFRASLVRALQHHARIEVVAEAADGRAALEAIRTANPDIAVLDLKMPGLDGNLVLNAISREKLPTKVILLSGLLEDDQVYAAVEKGAAAVLSKSAEATEVVDALLAVSRGEVVMAPELYGAVANQIRMRARDDRAVLTDREQEILKLMSQGMSGPQIAREIFLSPSTVKSHTEKLYGKLGVSDRAAAVAVAMRQGLLE
jgi:two-component system, NarL family, nitrate/nitrite response regulator NarL